MTIVCKKCGKVISNQRRHDFRCVPKDQVGLLSHKFQSKSKQFILMKKQQEEKRAKRRAERKNKRQRRKGVHKTYKKERK